MKLNITIVLLMMSSMMIAQNPFASNSSLTKEVKEEYLGDLFKKCKLIYCERDTLSEMTFHKEMEVYFFDTTFFFSARVYSSPFTKSTYTFDAYDCDSVHFDDGGEGLNLNAKNLMKYSYLKTVLDALVRQTPFVEYIGGFSVPEDGKVLSFIISGPPVVLRGIFFDL